MSFRFYRIVEWKFPRRIWRRINMVTNRSCQNYIVAKKHEISQMRVNIFEVRIHKQNSRKNWRTVNSPWVNFQPFAGRSSFRARVKKILHWLSRRELWWILPVHWLHPTGSSYRTRVSTSGWCSYVGIAGTCTCYNSPPTTIRYTAKTFYHYNYDECTK